MKCWKTEWKPFLIGSQWFSIPKRADVQHEVNTESDQNSAKEMDVMDEAAFCTKCTYRFYLRTHEMTAFSIVKPTEPSLLLMLRIMKTFPL